MRWQLINWVLLVIVGIEIWGLVNTLATGPSGGETVVSAAERRRKADVPPLPSRRLDPALASAIRAGDLFDPTRHAPPTAATTPEDVPPPSGLELKGVVKVGGESEAILTDTSPDGKRAGKQMRVRVGEEVAGHRVTSITDEEVVLTSPGGEEVRLVLAIEPAGRSRASKTARRGAKAQPRQPQRAGAPPTVSRLGAAGGRPRSSGAAASERTTAVLDRLMDRLPQDVQERLRQSRMRRARALRERAARERRQGR